MLLNPRNFGRNLSREGSLILRDDYLSLFGEIALE